MSQYHRQCHLTGIGKLCLIIIKHNIGIQRQRTCLWINIHIEVLFSNSFCKASTTSAFTPMILSIFSCCSSRSSVFHPAQTAALSVYPAGWKASFSERTAFSAVLSAFLLCLQCFLLFGKLLRQRRQFFILRFDLLVLGLDLLILAL